MEEKKVKRALFPGSFDPFTIGHSSLVERGLEIFDEIVIAVGISVAKHTEEEIAIRVKEIAALYEDDSRVKVVSYSCLTVDVASEYDCPFILRGVRNLTDFEYERNMADVNRKLSGIETVILVTLPHLATVSSSIVRELRRFGHDVTPYLPKPGKV